MSHTQAKAQTRKLYATPQRADQHWPLAIHDACIGMHRSRRTTKFGSSITAPPQTVGPCGTHLLKSPTVLMPGLPVTLAAWAARQRTTYLILPLHRYSSTELASRASTALLCASRAPIFYFCATAPGSQHSLWSEPSPRRTLLSSLRPSSHSFTRHQPTGVYTYREVPQEAHLFLFRINFIQHFL